MQRSVVTRSLTAGSSAVVPMDAYISPFNVGIGVVVTGTVDYTVQHTFDNVLAKGYSAASGNWFNHPTLLNQTANADGNYAFPVTGIRITLNSGTGTVTMYVIQAGK
jgi:hypothetical protein